MKKYHYRLLSCFLYTCVGSIFTASAQTPKIIIQYRSADLKERVDFKGNLAERIDSDPDYKTFSKILSVSGLQNKLQSAQNYTIFVPVEDAFASMSAGKLDSMLTNRNQSATFISSLIVLGKLERKEIAALLKGGRETFVLKSLNGSTLQLAVDVNRNLVITDANGTTAFVTRFDVNAANGVINNINKVLYFPYLDKGH
ncbi:MAG: fasciclin domain-containing protein [Sphingobacteriaceae bacterium]